MTGIFPFVMDQNTFNKGLRIMKALTKLMAATAVALTMGAASTAQSAIFIGVDSGMGIVETMFADGPFTFFQTNVGGFNSVSIEGDAPVSPGLLHSEVVNLNSSGPASLTLYVTRTDLSYTNFSRFKSGFGFSAIGSNFTVASSTLVSNSNLKYTGNLLSSASFSGSDSQSANQTVLSPFALNNPYSVTHKYVITGGNGSVSPDITLTAVPEPGTWALMIGGFAGAGAMLCRRRSLGVVA